MNKVILMGRLTRDPELRYTAGNNTAVCSFTLAIPRRFSRNGEEKKSDFLPVVAWSKLAEFCSKYFTKGRQVSIVGRIQTRSYDDEQGVKRYVTEIVAEEAYFADSKKADNSPVQENDGIEGYYPVEDVEDEEDGLPLPSSMTTKKGGRKAK